MTNTDGYESRTYPSPASVSELAYWPAEQLLRARFRTGATYSYRPVPPEVWETVRDSLSPGSAFRLLVVNKARPRVGGADALRARLGMGLDSPDERPYVYVREATE